jgi:hypothetical protein
MLAGMSMSEYIHWQAIYETEPFPEERSDRRTAEIIQTLAVVGHFKEIPKIADLLPDWWGEQQTPQQTPAQIKENMKLIKAATRKKKK